MPSKWPIFSLDSGQTGVDSANYNRGVSVIYRRPRAFTVIELLIVIGILAVLATIIGFAMTGVTHRMKASAVTTTMENLKSLVAELEAKSKGRQPATYYVNGAVVPPPYSIWNDARPDQNLGAGGTPSNEPLPTPKNVTRNYADSNPSGADRYLSDAVLNTQLVMGLLKSVPLNAQAIAKFPSNQLMSERVPAPPKLTVNAGNGAPSPELILDPWGNPIIFVPSAGLTGVWVGYNSGDVMAAASYDNTNYLVKSKDGRGFWASAGPDGDFQHGDDNIYSFQQ
jgi:prepilin-type N-terminal cleavage/methylation domain-containing protein